MPPSMNRRYWRSMLVAGPATLVVSALAVAGGWGLGWYYLGLATISARRSST
jgi:hypothetical protein